MNNLIAAYTRLTSHVYQSWYAIPIRVIVGYGFMEHGYAKIMHGPESFTTILHALGMPAPGLLAWATILVELFGGLAVFLGAFIPIVSIPMAIVLFVAIFTVHLPNGFSSIKLLSVDAAGAHFGQPGYETDLLYFAGLLALVLGGSGPLAFDNIILRRSSKATKTKSVLGGCIMALLAVASGAAYAQMKTTEIAAAENAGRVDDAEGNLRVPADYRTAYQFLGSWAVAADQGQGSKEIHVVYASPGTIAAYRKDGWFPDGSVLVKEVSEATTGAMTTGDVSHANILKGWFVMMKDSKNSHPDNKLWGDGWGWSWFDAAAPSKTTSTNYKVDCQTCHVPARASDWIYVQGYPALKQ